MAARVRVHAPRVLAGIDSLEETLEDRSLSVFMLRKRRAEPVSPIGRATDAEAGRLREQCALACLTNTGAIGAAYEGVPAALQREGIDDRAVDLRSPLPALAIVADAEDRGQRVAEVLAAARALGALCDADAEGGGAATLLDALEAIRTRVSEKLTLAALLSALRSRGGWEDLTNVRRLAAILNPLGIARHQVRDNGGRRWCYVLDAAQLADLRARYGGSTETGDGAEFQEAATTPERPDTPRRSQVSPRGGSRRSSGASGANADEHRGVPDVPAVTVAAPARGRESSPQHRTNGRNGGSPRLPGIRRQAAAHAGRRPAAARGR